MNLAKRYLTSRYVPSLLSMLPCRRSTTQIGSDLERMSLSTRLVHDMNSCTLVFNSVDNSGDWASGLRSGFTGYGFENEPDLEEPGLPCGRGGGTDLTSVGTFSARLGVGDDCGVPKPWPDRGRGTGTGAVMLSDSSDVWVSLLGFVDDRSELGDGLALGRGGGVAGMVVKLELSTSSYKVLRWSITSGMLLSTKFTSRPTETSASNATTATLCIHPGPQVWVVTEQLSNTAAILYQWKNSSSWTRKAYDS